MAWRWDWISSSLPACTEGVHSHVPYPPPLTLCSLSFRTSPAPGWTPAPSGTYGKRWGRRLRRAVLWSWAPTGEPGGSQTECSAPSRLACPTQRCHMMPCVTPDVGRDTDQGGTRLHIQAAPVSGPVGTPKPVAPQWPHSDCPSVTSGEPGVLLWPFRDQFQPLYSSMRISWNENSAHFQTGSHVFFRTELALWWGFHIVGFFSALCCTLLGHRAMPFFGFLNSPRESKHSGLAYKHSF